MGYKAKFVIFVDKVKTFCWGRCHWGHINKINPLENGNAPQVMKIEDTVADVPAQTNSTMQNNVRDRVQELNLEILEANILQQTKQPDEKLDTILEDKEIETKNVPGEFSPDKDPRRNPDQKKHSVSKSDLGVEFNSSADGKEIIDGKLTSTTISDFNFRGAFIPQLLINAYSLMKIIYKVFL